MSLLVCAAEQVPAQCRAQAPSHLLSLVSPGQKPPRAPPGVARLTLHLNDIATPAPGLVAPSAEHMEEMLAFARGWSGDQRLIVHCFAGVSRSPAAALAIACQRHPQVPDDVLAQALRRMAPQATPNPLMVELADRLLGRGGGLIGACRAIGRGVPWTGSHAFDLLAGLSPPPAPDA